MGLKVQYTSVGGPFETVRQVGTLHGAVMQIPGENNGIISWIIDEPWSAADVCNFANALGSAGIHARCNSEFNGNDALLLRVTLTALSGEAQKVEHLVRAQGLTLGKHFNLNAITEWEMDVDQPLQALSDLANELGCSGAVVTWAI